MKSEYLLAHTQAHLIQPSHISGTYKVKVFLPIRRADVDERFPVIYITDGDFFFGAISDICGQLQMENEMARAIVVSIGYADARAAQLLRWRDFFSHTDRALFQSLLEELVSAPLLRDSCQLHEATQTTDAGDFLEFIATEVMPFIDARYPTIQGDNSYAGYSAGASFGLYALSSQPQTFRQYLIGSPVVSFGGTPFGLALAKSFREYSQRPPVRIFLSVGELEEFAGNYGFTTGYYELAKLFRAPGAAPVDLTLKLFPGETHATGWVVAFTHGLRTLFAANSGSAPWLRAQD